jgi:uncharacterized protein (DUF2141 family)
VKPQKTTKNVNFEFPADYMKTDVQSLALDDASLRVNEYSVSGRVEIEGTRAPDEELVVGAYPAQLRYRSLNSYLRDPVLTTVAEKDGSFSFESMPPGAYRLMAYIDVNENGLQEGIDLTTRPEESPVISIET